MYKSLCLNAYLLIWSHNKSDQNDYSRASQQTWEVDPMPTKCWFAWINPLSHHDALKHHITSLETEIIFLQLRASEWKFPSSWFTNTLQFSVIFQQLQIIFIHYKSWIATALRGLSWMKVTMVNSGLKGLKHNSSLLSSSLIAGYVIAKDENE